LEIKRTIGAATMSFFLGILFYMIAAAILVDLPGFALAAVIRGRQIDIIEHILKPFAGFVPQESIWNGQDYAVGIIVWLLVGLMAGFAGKERIEGGIAGLLAYSTAAAITIFGGAANYGTDSINASIIEFLSNRVSNILFTEGFIRLILFGLVALLSGSYFGYLSKLDKQKIDAFWNQLDESSHKLSLPVQCPNCQTTFESNPLFCSNCSHQIREEVKSPSL